MERSSVKVRDPKLARALGPVTACVQNCLDAGQLPQGRLHVGVSGGADSTLLFFLLYQLRRRLGLQLSVGHVDHGLRAASPAEARWVRGVAERYEVPFAVDKLTLDPGPDLALRARLARRARLVEQARALGGQVVAFAHTATDQMETMLMHASRGAGLAGLGAMRGWDAPFLRPLLHLTRDEVIDLCGRCGLAFVRDPSNHDDRHPRVRVRQGVVPVLNSLNPRAESAWVRLAQQARDAEEALEAWAMQELEGRWCASGQLDLSDLDLVPRAVAQRLIRHACGELGVSLSELRHEVLRKICDAGRKRAAVAAGRCPAPVGGLGPLRFDLHPRGHLTVHKTKLSFFAVARR